MSKNQQKTTFNTAAGDLNSTTGFDATAESSLQNSTNAAANQFQGSLSSAAGAYNNLNPAGISNILAPGTTAATNIANTGGYSAPQLNTLESAEATNLGGLDPTALNALGSQYQNLISSGGVSDATAAAMQRQAVSGVSSVYGALSDQQKRNRAVTGGQGGGGETAEMARQLSSAEANAITGVNSTVGQLRQQGTEAGLSGASNLAASQAAAQNAAANTFSGTQSNVASGLQTGSAQLGNIGSTALSGNLASAGGLAGLAGLTAAQQQALQSATLNQEQIGNNAQLGYLGAESGIANAQKGFGANLLSGIGAVSQLASGAGNLIYGINY